MPQLVENLVARFYDRLWNEWDDAAVNDTLGPDITFRGSLGRETVGRDEWRSYRDQMRCAAPDFHNVGLDIIATDDWAAVRLRFTGTHCGPLLDIPPTGRTFAYAGVGFFTVTDGLITEFAPNRSHGCAGDPSNDPSFCFAVANLSVAGQAAVRQPG